MAVKDLWTQPIKAVNLGNEGFANELKSINVDTIHLQWKPIARGQHELIKALDSLSNRPEIHEANEEALRRINSSQAVLIDIQNAIEVIPGMDENTILHAGPPITWDRMSGPLRGAIIGALIFEGRAENEEKAAALASSGVIKFSPCHEHDAVGPMAGIISPSMPVFVIKNTTYGNLAFCTLNEGLGKVLRFGAYNSEVINRLKWMKNILAPGLAQAIRLSGGIDIKTIIAQALHMGDELHNRNKAGTSLFIRTIMPYLVGADLSKEELESIVKFMNSNDHFFLNLSMPAGKAILEAANGIENSTMVVTMSRNGTDFGIRVSGLKDQWFTAPAEMVKGLLFPGYTEEDCNPDLGDSAITETAGYGGFAMAAAIAIVQFVGGVPQDAIDFSNKMYEITVGESSAFSIPVLDFRGTATGIDVRKVIEKNILPQINTGIAHKKAGIGQVGAGLVNPPWECFAKAIIELGAKL
jgi:hypothetical protein